MEQIIEEAELDEEQMKKVERQFASNYKLITDDDRLEKISEDIVDHFMNRGNSGKAMVICIDKATAIKMYNNIIDEWSYDILADDAIYLLARLYDSMLNDQVKAQNLYERIIVEYNSSIFASESRRRFREIRGDKIQ